MTMPKKERVIAAGEFKATCLALLDDVARDGSSVLVTKRGRPVARLVAIVNEEPKRSLLGSVLREDDLVSPIGEVWNADS